ncbi:integrase zinc binding domain-containing protein, partial [Xanthomonas translucens]|uniref:integrase zinc binding domain-containing protein n=1 Tax=Xanthomonas campestris pv. translucens TaxID=343 RepID=UPI0035E6D502
MIMDRRGKDNGAADHLSRLEGSKEDVDANEKFPDEQLLALLLHESPNPWFADYANFLACGITPAYSHSHERRTFFKRADSYFWDEPYLFKFCADQLIRRCVDEREALSIIRKCHDSPFGGHHGTHRMAHKVLECGFYWPTIFEDARKFVKACDA